MVAQRKAWRKAPREGGGILRRIVILAVVITVLAIGAYQLYLTFRYRLYDGYKAVLSESVEFAEASAFTPLTGLSVSVDGYQPALESDALALFIQPKTGSMAVYDKRTKQTTYSNPPDAASDPIANPGNKESLQSQLIVTYFDTNGNVAEINSYKMATLLNQVEVNAIPDGIRVTYTMGDTKPKAGILPLYVKQERLTEILSAIPEEKTRNLLANRWEADITHPGTVKLLTSVINNPSGQKSLIKQFEQIGYTNEMRIEDEANSGADVQQKPGFVIAVEYRLEGDSLIAVIPTGHITEMGGAAIDSIRLLPYFGAAGISEEGYVVVPNGSGSLIRFNNGKTSAEDYRQFVYDIDPMLLDNYTYDQAEPVRIGLFGIQKDGQGILASIDNGASLAQIFASVSGKLTSYNAVYPSFTLRTSALVRVSGANSSGTRIPVVEKVKADLPLTVRYSFLTDEYDGYSGMARYEHERLIAEGILKQQEPTDDIPLFMDLIGSVRSRMFFLGMAYQGQIPMTTYAQARSIVDELNLSGVGRLVVNYQGWFNRGYYHDVADRIIPERALGDVSELTALASDVESRGGKLVTDVIFQQVPFNSKRYNWSLENSRYCGYGYAAVFGRLNPLTYDQDGGRPYPEAYFELISPKFVGRYVDSFINAYSSYDLSGVSLRDLGSYLVSDRKRTEIITRDQAEELVVDSLAKLAGSYNLTIRGGNAYAWPFAAEITDAPLGHNAYNIVDEEIPWIEMILSGCITYTGSALNLSVQGGSYAPELWQPAALRLIEFGASPHFTFTYEDVTRMQDSALNTNYSSTFSVWKDAAASIYSTVNTALSQVSGKGMVSHTTVAPGVKRVEYEGGTTIFINYNDTDYVIDGTRIPAMDCVVKGGVAR
ncbi:hypothetical protein AGMMS49992_00600 [Clostridia bacterium]|nr:hypothetical protein AGMMS49992_00600 [Clostridia bacterium]